jgi:hypothetical protein
MSNDRIRPFFGVDSEGSQLGLEAFHPRKNRRFFDTS